MARNVGSGGGRIGHARADRRGAGRGRREGQRTAAAHRGQTSVKCAKPSQRWECLAHALWAAARGSRRRARAAPSMSTVHTAIAPSFGGGGGGGGKRGRGGDDGRDRRRPEKPKPLDKLS